MSKLTVSRDKLLDLYNGLEGVLKSDEKRDFKFNFAVICTKQKIEAEVKEAVEVLKQFEKDIHETLLDNCTKDENGNPITKRDGSSTVYIGADGACVADLNKAENDYLDEEIEVEVFELTQKQVPEKLTGKEQEAIMWLISDS